MEKDKGCVATKKLIVCGYKVDFMCKGVSTCCCDSGWFFCSKHCTNEETQDANYLAAYSIERLLKHDPDIEPYLDLPPNVAFQRRGKKFVQIKDFEFADDDEF